MPDQLTQYNNAITDLAVFDLGPHTQIELRGSDRLSFLHNFCTNDIKKLRPGEGCEAFLTNIKGRIIGHIIVSATEDALWLDSEPGTSEAIIAHLDQYIITENVTITDHSTEFVSLLLIGPQTESWMTTQIDSFPGLSAGGQITTSLAQVKAIFRRVPFTALPTFEVIASQADASQVRQSFLNKNMTFIAPEVFETLRIEAGFPRYGIDITDANIAQEAGRTNQAISFNKGCYLGQEPIARLDALGHVNKQLRTVQIDQGPVPSPGSIVTLNTGEEAGYITSAALSPSTGIPIALAMLRSTSLSPDIDLTVGTAHVTEFPIT
ncbi:MAG: folate-binding protein YgfZ [Planctomycetaceae bacterium]|nr:folate-binding protein YgfZ [Planctomycetaceae bacterium]